MAIRVNVRGLDAVARKFEGFGREFSHAMVLTGDKAGTKMVQDIIAQFQLGRDPDGNPWTPLADSTVASKGFDTILVRANHLRGGIQVDVAPDGSGFAVGATVPYWIYHQEGAANLPQRPIFYTSAGNLSERDELTIENEVAYQVQRLFDRLGGRV